MNHSIIESFPEILVEKYVFPLFYASSKEQLMYRMTIGTILYGIVTFLIPFEAPYGRYSKKWAGFGVPVKIAWFLQESPSFYIPIILAYYGIRNLVFKSISNQILLGMFIIHYFQRSIIYPFLMKSKQPTPFLPFICALLTCFYNGILHGYYFVSYQAYSDRVWLWQPSFWLGFIMFLYGMNINVGSDSILRNLRKGSNKGSYLIPRGGMFERVSCANYFGEIIQMWGYALASLSPPAGAHALFTTLFLSRRALQHHQWYLKKFDNYPKSRKAIIPYLI